MFEKIYLDRRTCSHFYILMVAAFKIIYFLIFATFIYFLWEQRHTYMELFETQKMIKAHDTKNWTEYTDLFKLVGMETIYFLVKIFVINLVIKAFNNFKVPNVWMRKWDDDGEVDNLFGRHLCEHIRFYRKINFKDFNSLHRFCNQQNKNLNKIGKDNNLIQLFTKYDKNYIADKKM
jgi:hypothetical protein